MKILLAAATQEEIEPFKNKEIDMLICGVGIPSTIYHLTKKLLNENYDLVIQAGIAGSFSKKIKKEDIVAVEMDAFGDIGVEEKGKFKSVFEMGLEDKNSFPFENEWLINKNNFLTNSSLKKVKAITVNKISDSKKQIKKLRKIFDPDIETMEGAAFHYVCLQQKIPFIQIRSISNKVGERDKSKWEMKEAIQNLNKELIKLIESIKDK